MVYDILGRLWCRLDMFTDRKQSGGKHDYSEEEMRFMM